MSGDAFRNFAAAALFVALVLVKNSNAIYPP